MSVSVKSAFCCAGSVVLAAWSVHTLVTCKDLLDKRRTDTTEYFNRIKPYIVKIDRDNKVISVYSDNPMIKSELHFISKQIPYGVKWEIIVLESIEE